MPKTYYTHDNSRKPYKVVVDNDIKIYGEDNYYNENGDIIEDYPNLVYEIPSFENVFIGKTEFKNEYGNSLLVNIKDNKYVFIGGHIHEFDTKDKIIKYFSPVGNNDIPYPYALGEKYIYLMIEYVKVEKHNVVDNENRFEPYDYYYNRNYDRINKGQKNNNIYTNFNYTVLKPRYTSTENYGKKYKITWENYVNSDNWKYEMEQMQLKEQKKKQKIINLWKRS